MPAEGSPSGINPSASVARRRQTRVEADRPAPPSVFSRLIGWAFYFLWVAVGVIVVLSLMDPRQPSVSAPTVPSARLVLERIVQSSRFSPAGISQTVLDSLLVEQGAVTFESPVRFIPMPSWEANHVEIRGGGVGVRFSMSLLGWPIRFSESFVLQGAPGAWSLTPKSATVGMLDLPEPLLPVVSLLLKPAVMPFSKDLEMLSKAGSLALRPGIVEFTTR